MADNEKWRCGDTAYAVRDLYLNGYVYIEKGTKVVVDYVHTANSTCLIHRSAGSDQVECGFSDISVIQNSPELHQKLKNLCKEADNDYTTIFGYEQSLSEITRMINNLNSSEFRCRIRVETEDLTTGKTSVLAFLTCDFRHMSPNIDEKLREVLIEALKDKEEHIQKTLDQIAEKYKPLF